MDILTELTIAELAMEVSFTVVVKASFLLAITWVISHFLKHKSASLRHTFWATAFISLLILPVLVMVLPEWGALVYLQNPQKQSEQLLLDARPISEELILDNNLILQQDTDNAEITSATSKEAELVSFEAPALPFVQTQPVANSWTPLVWQILLLIWITGVSILLSRIGLHYLQTKLLSETAEPDTDSTLAKILDTNTYCNNVRILYSDNVIMPMTWGFRNPVIMLPKGAIGWTNDRLQAVVLHELAHVQRNDYLTFIGMQVVCALYWFNPLIWMSARRLVFEQERACDDKVLQRGIKPSAYATYLLDIAQQVRMKPDNVLRVLSMAGPSTLKERMHAILNGSSERTSVTGGIKLFASCLTFVIMTPLAGLTSCKTEIPDAPSAVHTWTLALTDSSSVVRKKAAWALGNLESREALEPLIKALKDQDNEVRGMVAWALGEIKDRRAVPALIEALSDEDAYDRERIVMALGEIEDEQAIESLVPLLNSNNEGIRIASAWALGEIKHAKAIDALAVKMSDADLRTREAIVRALGQTRSEKAVPHLIAAFGDNQVAVRKVAIAASLLTRSSLIVDPLLMMLQNDASEEVRVMIAEYIWVFNSPASRAGLIAALEDESPQVRERSAWALGKLQDAFAVDALIETLRDDHADVRAMAVWALDEIQLP